MSFLLTILKKYGDKTKLCSIYTNKLFYTSKKKTVLIIAKKDIKKVKRRRIMLTKQILETETGS